MSATQQGATEAKASGNKRVIVVHDVLGTLFSLSKPIEAVTRLFGPQLGAGAGASATSSSGSSGSSSSTAVASRYAELVVMDWYHCGMRDFTNLSINGAYTPIGQCFRAALPRVLLMAGLVPPESSPNGPASAEVLADARRRASESPSPSHSGAQAANVGTNVFGEELINAIFSTLFTLDPRPGMVEAFTKTYRDAKLLEQAGVRHVGLWGATNGSRDLAGKLFKGALGSSGVSEQLRQQDPATKGADRGAGVGSDAGSGFSIWSCDDVRVAKPDPRVYTAVLKAIGADDDNDNGKASLWFVASHSWDTDAAKRAGFKTCWCNYEEFYPMALVDASAPPDSQKTAYLPADIVVSSLDEAARKILEWEARAA